MQLDISEKGIWVEVTLDEKIAYGIFEAQKGSSKVKDTGVLKCVEIINLSYILK